MKHDAIVEQGIPILERVPIPDDLIPEDSRVEIDAKIHAGYCKHCPSTSYPTQTHRSRVMTLDRLLIPNKLQPEKC